MNKLRILLISFIVVATSFVAQSQKNYELYSIENIEVYTPSLDNKSLFTIETINNVPTLFERDLVSGEILRTFKTKLPTSNIGNITVSNDGKTIYIVTNKDVENERLPLSDAIYSISLKNGKLKKLHTISNNLGFLTHLQVIDNNLILRPYKGISYIFNISKNSLKPILEDDNYRLVFASAEKNGAIFIKIEDSELLDLYFCDFAKKMKLSLIGKFQPSLVLSTEEDENKVPYFVVEDKKFDWIYESYNKNRYPSPVMKLADNKFVMDNYSKLNEYEYISLLSLIDNTYLIGDRASKNIVSVYNLKNPKTTKTPTVSEEDMIGIENLINSEISFENQIIESEALSTIFDANFYKITFTEKETKESSRTQEFLAYSEGSYISDKKRFSINRNKC